MPDYSEHYARTERKMRNLLLRLGGQIPTNEQTTVSHFLDVNEYGLALEALAYSVIEAKKAVSPDIVQEIDALAESMKLGLEPFVRDFDAFAVHGRSATA